jgi:hypothetical protein
MGARQQGNGRACPAVRVEQYGLSQNDHSLLGVTKIGSGSCGIMISSGASGLNVDAAWGVAQTAQERRDSKPDVSDGWVCSGESDIVGVGGGVEDDRKTKVVL